MLAYLDKYTVLDYLLCVAAARNISQRNLCEGIIDLSHFNRICNRKEDRLTWDILLSMAAKLKVDEKEIYDYCYVHNKKMYDEIMEQLEYYKIHYEYDKIKELHEKYSVIRNKSMFELQLDQYTSAIVSLEVDKDAAKAFKQFVTTIKLTNPLYNEPNISRVGGYSIKPFQLSDEELKIHMGVIICICMLSSYERVIPLYEDVVEYIHAYSDNRKMLTTVLLDVFIAYYMERQLPKVEVYYKRFKKDIESDSTITKGELLAYYSFALFVANKAYENVMEEALRILKKDMNTYNGYYRMMKEFGMVKS